MILERNQTFEEVLMHFEQKNLESVFFRTPLGAKYFLKGKRKPHKYCTSFVRK